MAQMRRLGTVIASLLLAALVATTMGDQSHCSRLEAERVIESDGGRFDMWRSDRCEALENAGMEGARIQLRERGLLMPMYTDSAMLIYCTRGQAMMGMSLPMGARRDYRIIRKGEVVAVPRGMVFWFYNMGDESRGCECTRGREHCRDEDRQRKRRHEQHRREEEHGGECHLLAMADTSMVAVKPGRCSGFMLMGGRSEQCGSVMRGFSKEMLAAAWNVDEQTVDRLVNSQEERGIIRVEEDHPFHDLMCNQCGREGSESESMGSMSTVHFMYDMEHANCDRYSSQGGCMTILNRFRLPVLQTMRPQTGMGAIRTRLEPEAMVAPGYMANGHNMVYCSRGSVRVQVVRPNGERCFDEEMKEGDMLMIPMGYPVMKRAGREGCELIAFTTTDLPMPMHMAGEDSVFRNMPQELLMAAFNVDEKMVKEMMKRRTRHAAVLPPSREEREYDESYTRGGHPLPIDLEMFHQNLQN